MSVKLIAALLLSASASVTAHAGVIYGGSTLLNAAGVTQLESWMGGGTLTLTNIFTKIDGQQSTSKLFHAAADGKGATITVFQAAEAAGPMKLIGGYNPRSWASIGDLVKTPNPADWTAFIFNLTDHVKKQQSEKHQTRNTESYGPTFGGGNDIVVTSNLNGGGAKGLSYGTASDLDRSIVDGSLYNGNDIRVGTLEVFTVQYSPEPPAVVPEPGTLALAGLGLLGMVALRRRQ